MTPEQRAERRKEMKAQWDKMTPEERKAMGGKKEHKECMPNEDRAKKRQEMHESMQKMTPEERAKFKQEHSQKMNGSMSPPSTAPTQAASAVAPNKK
jgi:hypothetical protein